MREIKLPFRSIDYYQRAKKNHFTPEEKKNIEQPFPLLIASTKLKSMCYLDDTEFNFKSAKWGEEIDLVFVLAEHKEKMKEWLKLNLLDKKIRVETVDMFDKIKEIPLTHADFQVNNQYPFISVKDHQNLNQFIIAQAAPLYKAPYPDGTFRKYHDPRHAAAVYLFSNCIAEMYKEKGIVSKKSPQHLLASAFLHDSARQNDGVDLWDKESGDKTKELLTQHLQSSKEDAEYFGKCLAEKDSKQPFSLDQKIIHDADCMEIVRCLYNADDFSPDELWMLKDLDQPVVFEFIKEAKEFIGLTMKPEVNSFINQSENPVSCMVQIANFSETCTQRFPLIMRLTNSARQAFCKHTDYCLNPKIEQIIMDNAKLAS